MLGRRLLELQGCSVLAGYLAALLLATGCAASSHNVPSGGSSISPRSVSGPNVVPQAEGKPSASPPRQIQYLAAGINVPVHVLEPDEEAIANRSLVPPETMDGYWLSSFGSPGVGSSNTTYIIGHSWVGREAPFNSLSTAAVIGDTLTVLTGTGQLKYQVESVTTHTKSNLRDSEIWAVVPNRLVLISCHTADPWGKNVVVVASPELAVPQARLQSGNE
jgi:hypothetical protein